MDRELGSVGGRGLRTSGDVLEGGDRVTLGCMSISRDFDAWMAANGIVPEVEIVPDHACQVFLPSDGVRISLDHAEGEEGHTLPAALSEARDLISRHLR